MTSCFPTRSRTRAACSTQISNFWFGRNYPHVVPNQLTGIDPESVVPTDEARAGARPLGASCKKLKPLPIEAVVRGYIIGSGWKDYQQDRHGLRHRAAARA